jgi:hypothetical protein
MSSPAALDNPRDQTGSPLGWVWLWAAIFVVSAIFISADSFWIDEGNTAYKASQATITGWAKAMFDVTGSDSQMPGFMLYAWGWQKLSGNSEFALRLSNLPWLAVLVFALRRYPCALLAALTAPFVLNYLNDFRPYLMQIAGAALAFRGVSRLDEKPSSAWAISLTGCLIMSASSLLGVIWALGVLVYVLVEFPARLRCRWFWKVGLAFFPAFGLLGAFYAWTLVEGQGAAPMSSGLIVSLAASGYELLGLAGLGPSKIELRVHPRSLLGYVWILFPAALVLGGTLLCSLSQWISNAPKRRVIAAGWGIGIPILVLLTLIYLKDFRVLARHLAPLVVLLALLLGNAISPVTRSLATRAPSRYLRIAGFAALALGLVSSLSLRFAPQHRKDDYREAAAIARLAIEQKTPVLWAADRWSAYFYGLDKDHTGWNYWKNDKALPELTGKEMVFLSKPDIYDPKGSLQTLLKERGFIPIHQLTAFTIFTCDAPLIPSP